MEQRSLESLEHGIQFISLYSVGTCVLYDEMLELAIVLWDDGTIQ